MCVYTHLWRLLNHLRPLMLTRKSQNVLSGCQKWLRKDHKWLAVNTEHKFDTFPLKLLQSSRIQINTIVFFSNIVYARNQPHRLHFSGCYCVPRSHVCTVCLPAKGAWTSPVSMEQAVLRSGWSSLPDHRQRSGLLPPDLPAGCGSGDWKRQESTRRNITITISQKAANPLHNNSAH